MSLPFQCLSPLGQSSKLFCAAKGCSIQTFELGAGSQPLFSWTHPSVKQSDNAKQAAEATQGGQDGEEQSQEQPPSKRRKLGSGDAESNAGSEAAQGVPDAPGPSDAPANGGKSQKKGKTNRAPAATDAPLVALLMATADGGHVIAVTGQDKTLWVFEHDGKGSLTETSRRAMPKRPCSLALTADGRTILSADKFGDVYALPLDVNQEGEEEKKEEGAVPTPVTTHRQGGGANHFTVHSQRNRRALEYQARQLEINAKQDLPKDGPKFAHQVLLGHVSLLTSVCTAHDAQGRPYIITADRDEHIRVSRGMPQAHVTEAFCLGHQAFVNALCNHPSRPDILVSGGGDNELFVWNWLAGQLLCTVDLLVHVRKIVPDATKLAVVKLVAIPTTEALSVVATCERVPALFVFRLEPDNTLSHRETIELRGNPLDITNLAPEQLLLAAIDAPNSDGEISVIQCGESLIPQESIHGAKDGTEAELALSREDLDKALYAVENLRKTGHDEPGDEAAPDALEHSLETKLEQQ
ncbi:hypothetical protein F4808DRAFT_176469 [Astrocystis sublimbata]|nr:hypothetical protein F4808DRAFT_176469 [Astrocystis sublimbata]